MLDDRVEVLKAGDESGNDMIIKVCLSSGREIFGFATRNFYGGEWDLGPTWNYFIVSDRNVLFDAGRRGTGSQILEMMEYAGVALNEQDTILLSHGHEDHDGGLFELVKATGAQVMAHHTYNTLIRRYPSEAPSPEKRALPASCWHCPMPVSFSSKYCPDYHAEREAIKISPISSSTRHIQQGISVFHVPGHSPDAVALLVDDEAMLVGDTILPEITPHPTLEQTFEETGAILGPEYVEAQQLYGLRAFMRSIAKLREVANGSDQIRILPGHRLYNHGKWNDLSLPIRIDELFDHHIQRCSEILNILDQGPKTPDEICEQHFEPSLLEGIGANLARNEVLSHCELLALAGDVILEPDKRISATGESRFESRINDIRINKTDQSS